MFCFKFCRVKAFDPLLGYALCVFEALGICVRHGHVLKHFA